MGFHETGVALTWTCHELFRDLPTLDMALPLEVGPLASPMALKLLLHGNAMAVPWQFQGGYMGFAWQSAITR